MQGSNADVVPFLDGYAFRFHVFQYLLRLHLLIEAVFRYNHGRASVASLGFCVATLFYRILPSDALFFYIKKAAAFLQPPQHIFLFQYNYTGAHCILFCSLHLSPLSPFLTLILNLIIV